MWEVRKSLKLLLANWRPHLQWWTKLMNTDSIHSHVFLGFLRCLYRVWISVWKTLNYGLDKNFSLVAFVVLKLETKIQILPSEVWLEMVSYLHAVNFASITGKGDDVIVEFAGHGESRGWFEPREWSNWTSLS